LSSFSFPPSREKAFTENPKEKYGVRTSPSFNTVSWELRKGIKTKKKKKKIRLDNNLDYK